jgi:hypothetical protein
MDHGFIVKQVYAFVLMTSISREDLTLNSNQPLKKSFYIIGLPTG